MPRLQKQQTVSPVSPVSNINNSVRQNIPQQVVPKNAPQPVLKYVGQDVSQQSQVVQNNTPSINKFSNVVIEDTVFMNNSDGAMIINGSASFNGGFEVNSCGDDIAWFNTNVTISEGGNLTIGEPKTTEPSKVSLGGCDIIVYVSVNSDINIYETYPNSVILVLHNNSTSKVNIQYSNDNTKVQLVDGNSTTTWLKLSSTGYVQVSPVTEPVKEPVKESILTSVAEPVTKNDTLSVEKTVIVKKQ